jgi:pimeloyl-ACP methyl ester carboxylesterase
VVGRRAGVVGAALGVLAGGAAAGVAVKKVATGRLRLSGDPEADEPLGELRGEAYEVTADDGVPLHVEVDEISDFAGPNAASQPAYADITVVFSHAYALNLDAWHYQRKALRGEARLVLYDLRGHGRSGRGAPASATIDQLGADLERVIETVAAEGPLLLVGHSLGGMSVMALAERRPELFRDRVVGVALLGTSPGKLADVTWGAPAYSAKVLRRAAPGLVAALGRQHRIIERGRRLGRDVAFLLTKRYSFASDVSPSLVDFTARLLESTPVDVVAEFFPTFTSHDKLGALEALHGVETLVLVGDKDLITPADHSRELVRALPGAELVVLERTGHMLLLERYAEVNRHLRHLLGRASRAVDAARVG